MSLGDKLCEPIGNHVLSLDAIAHVKKSSFKIKMQFIVKLVTNFCSVLSNRIYGDRPETMRRAKHKAFCEIIDSLSVNKNSQRGRYYEEQ